MAHLIINRTLLSLLLTFCFVFVSLAQEVAVQATPAAKAMILTGTVISTNTREPVIGATVKVKNTELITTTNGSGRFFISTSLQEGVLVISHLGYLKEIIPFTKDIQDLMVTLDDDLGILKEVEIHTGFQDIKNERFVGSATVLDSAAYQRRSGMGIVERLDGTVAGVVFDKRASTPTMKIRGISTINTGLQKPLIVVDNFPYDGDLESINANDVESITILKDAAAASLWGARAGNGVIVITLKKVKFDKPLQIAVQSSLGITEKPDLYKYPQMKTSEFIDVERFLFDKGYYDAKLTNKSYPYSWPLVSPVIEFLNQAKLNPGFKSEAESRISELSNHDYRVELDRNYYQQAIQQLHHMSISGGSAKHAYNFAVGYKQNKSDIQNSKGTDGITLSTSNIYKPLKQLNLDLGISYSSFNDHSSGDHLPTKTFPYTQLADAEGNPLAVSERYRLNYVDTVGNGNLLNWTFMPLNEVKLADNYSNRRAIRLNFGLSYKPLNWLTAELKYQYADQKSSIRNHYSIDTWEVRDMINKFTNLNETNIALRYPVPLGGKLRLANSQYFSKNLRAQMKVNKDWGLHELIGLIGAEGSESNASMNQNALYGYVDETGTYNTNMDYVTRFPMYWLASNKDVVSNESYFNEGPLNRSVSLLANVTYIYNKKYVFYASARRDGANIFGASTNNKWRPLWSAGVSWDMKKEGFFSVEPISALRLKASIGYTGNVNNHLSGSPTMHYTSIFASNLNNLPIAQLDNPPNPNLRWEKVKTINYAINFGLFNNRISGELDFFHKESTDLISQIPFDPTVGVSSFTVNSASLKGKGFEANLLSVNSIGPVRWESNIGLAYAKSIVTKVYDGNFMASDFIDYKLHPSVGRLAYGLSSYKWAGLDGETGDPQGILNGEVSKDYKAIFKDSVDNQVFHGSSIPQYSGFIENSIEWKNFNLSANITYRLKYYFRQPSLNYLGIYEGVSFHADYSNRWRNPGDEFNTTVPSMIYPVPASMSFRDVFYANSEINVKRGDNIRIQDVRLSYSVPKHLLSSISLKNLEFYLYANNLNIMIWKAYKGKLDVDYSDSAGNYQSVPKSWTIGIKLGL